jgi:WD40 repeat protein
MQPHSRTFRVFISSTFSDLKEERNALHKEVFPKLKQLCQKQGCNFQAIDLRWGVSEEAALDQRTASICLQEVERCQRITPRPNFIILLGNRYGSTPLPEEIDALEFERIRTFAKNEMPEVQSLLERWYDRDDNADPPNYLLRRRKKEQEADYRQLSIWMQKVEEPIHRLLSAVAEAPLQGKQSVEYGQSLTEREIVAGALDSSVLKASEHVFAYMRDVPYLEQLRECKVEQIETLGQYVNFVLGDGSSGKTLSCDVNSREKLNALRKKIENLLGSTHVRKYTAVWNGAKVSTHHLEEFCDDVSSDLWSVIREEIKNLKPMDEEMAHLDFAQARGGHETFKGRADFLNRIETYLATDFPNHPMVVVGAEGTGKSALMARAADLAEEKKYRVIVRRFIGATPASVDGRSLLESICLELGRAYGKEIDVPIEYKLLVIKFRECLKWASRDKPLILFLDGLDQLAETFNARALAWLPTGPESNVRVVLSVRDDHGAASAAGANFFDPRHPLAILRRWLPEACFLTLSDLDESTAKQLLNEWLQADRRKRTLQVRQVNSILTAFKCCPRPLFLKLVTEEAKCWQSSTQPKLPDEPTADAMLNGIIHQFFNRLSDWTSHGPLLVEKVFGYLAASKDGLTEDELIGVLSTDDEFFSLFRAQSESIGQPLPPEIDSLPTAVWARLYSDLEPNLMRRQAANGVPLLDFFHESLRRVAKERFLSGECAERRHAQLTAFFSKQELFFESIEEQRKRKPPPTSRPVNVRKVVELPWQLLKVGDSVGLVKILTDIHFLESKAEGGLISELLTDFESVLATVQKDNPDAPILRRLFNAIQGEFAFLSRFPTSLFQCIVNSSGWTKEALKPHFHSFSTDASSQLDDSIDGSYSRLMDTWRAEKAKTCGMVPWIHALRPPAMPIDSSTRLSLGSLDCRVKNMAFSPDSRSLFLICSRDENASAASGKPKIGQFVIFDLEHRSEIPPRFAIHNEVVSMDLSPDGRRVVIGDDLGIIYVIDAERREQMNCFDSQHGRIGHRISNIVSPEESAGFDEGSWDEPPVLSEVEERSSEQDQTMDGQPWSEEYTKKYHREDCEVRHVRWSPDGESLITAGRDGTVSLWSGRTFNRLSTVSLHPGFIDALIFDQRGSLVCFTGTVLQVLTAATLERLPQIELQMEAGFPAPNGFQISHDGTYIAGAGASWRLTFWDSSDFKERGHSSAEHLDGYLNAVAFTPDDQFLLVGTSYGKILIFEVKSTKFIATSNSVIDGKITALNISPDGSVAIGTESGDLVVIELAALMRRRDRKGHRGPINAWKVHQESGLLITASSDGTAMIWDVGKLSEPLVLERHKAPLKCLDLAENLDLVATGDDDGRVITWKVSDGSFIMERQGSSEFGVHAVAFSPDRTWLAAGGNRYVWIWALENRDFVPALQFKTRYESVHEIVFDSASKYLFALHSHHATDAWHIATSDWYKPGDVGWPFSLKPDFGRGEQARERAYFLRNSSQWEFVQAIVAYEMGSNIIVGRWPGRSRLIAAVASNCWAISTGSSNLQFVELLKHGIA